MIDAPPSCFPSRRSGVLKVKTSNIIAVTPLIVVEGVQGNSGVFLIAAVARLCSECRSCV